MVMFFSLRYSKMVIFVLSATFCVTEISLVEEIELIVNCYVSFLNFHQNTESTAILYI